MYECRYTHPIYAIIDPIHNDLPCGNIALSGTGFYPAVSLYRLKWVLMVPMVFTNARYLNLCHVFYPTLPRRCLALIDISW